jgi:acyl-CoA thioester hydrolase
MESITPIRVRYAETDAMGIVHHAVYPVWMELGRSDFLRELGQSYAEWEAQGVMMSVGELQVKYRASAKYDELVEVRTRLAEAGRRKLVFAYEIWRAEVKLAEDLEVAAGCSPSTCWNGSPVPRAGNNSAWELRGKVIS